MRRRGIGTQVVQGTVTRQVELTSLYEDLQSAHHEPSTRVLAHENVAADEAVAAGLGVQPGDQTSSTSAASAAPTERPVAVLENYLPSEFADISTEPSSRSTGFTRSCADAA